MWSDMEDDASWQEEKLEARVARTHQLLLRVRELLEECALGSHLAAVLIRSCQTQQEGGRILSC